MANRHLSRSIALQALFEWDFANRTDSEIDGIIERIVPEFAAGMGDMTFVRALTSNILKKRPDLDTIIEKAAPDWPIQKISIVDRNILRLGLYELLFADRKEVPAKVAINEAIELAKTFGGETSGKFVNGVLGAVYKEMGEPGKDEQSSKKHRNFKNVPYEQMPIETLGGAVVYAHDKGEVYLALVHDVFGHWTLSKGGLEAGVDVKEGTKKEIKEEIGLDIEIKDELAKNEYIATHPEKGKIRKQVIYFLAESSYQDLQLKKSGGLDDARWFKLKDILDLNFYNDILPIITKAINLLLAKSEIKTSGKR
ncbi:MAG TPA: transcription antitermination factor NusB [Candidatus Paceibacterota bacterium]|nr:transcription antitermination factor NusB [Candidatus Paceibacterota bacterium]